MCTVRTCSQQCMWWDSNNLKPVEVTYSLALYNDCTRFLTAEGTSKNRIISPGKILHFYNAPPDSTTESLNEVMWWSCFSVTRPAVLPVHEVGVATQCGVCVCMCVYVCIHVCICVCLCICQIE